MRAGWLCLALADIDVHESPGCRSISFPVTDSSCSCHVRPAEPSVAGACTVHAIITLDPLNLCLLSLSLPLALYLLHIRKPWRVYFQKNEQQAEVMYAYQQSQTADSFSLNMAVSRMPGAVSCRLKLGLPCI